MGNAFHLIIFRLENEQLNNVGKFRAVNIQVPFADTLDLEDLLDRIKSDD